MSGNMRQKRLLIPLLILVPLLLAWGALAFGPLVAGGATPAADARPLLIQTDELKELIDKKAPDLRIIDFRNLTGYYLGHIPGAVHLWLPESKGRGRSSPALPPSAPKLANLLGRLGVGSQHTLIIYAAQGDQTRLWWLLAYYGFPLNRMRLLDGGYDAWEARNYPIQLTSPRFSPESFRFPARSRFPSRLATRQEVKAAQRAPGKIVLDVRPSRLSAGKGGKEGPARPGPMPGAVGVSREENLVTSGISKGCWKSPWELRELYASRGVTPDKDIYIYSHRDRCSTFGLMSLYLAGYPLDKLHLCGGPWIEGSRRRETAKVAEAN